MNTMNISIPDPERGAVIATTGGSPRSERELSGTRPPPASSRLMAWLAGLASLFLAASVARADRVPANCTESGLGLNLLTSLSDVHIGDTLYYSVNVFNGFAGSGQIACEATGIQAFVVTPDGKTNFLALLRTTLNQGDSDFYPNVVSYVVRAQDIQPDGTLLATARDIGVIHQNTVNSSGGGFQGVNTAVNLPCVLITALCFGGAGENGAITFTGTVTNCGNTTLAGVALTNFVNSQAFTVLFPTNLALGQAANFSGSWVPSTPCGPSTATLNVLATDQFTSTPQTVTSSAILTCQNTLTPGIAVTETCPATPAVPGGFLNYSGTVSNSGNTTLTNVLVVSAQNAAVAFFSAPSLAPGASASFTGSDTVPAGAYCSVTSTLVAIATGLCNNQQVTATTTSTCPLLIAPSVEVTLACPATLPAPLGSITYTGVVLNAGTVPLTNVVVVSHTAGGANTVVFTAASLAPQAAASFSFTNTVPPNCCSVASEVVAVAVETCGRTTVTDSDATICSVLASPQLSVTRQCPANAVATGGLLTFGGTVANTGNITIIGVTVVDTMTASNGPLLGPIDLAPGQTVPYTGSYVVPPDFCGTDTATASGTNLCSGGIVAGSATSTCPILTTPQISVTEACPAVPASPGGPLNYTGTVSNSGNVTLTNVLVVSAQNAAIAFFSAPSLAPGASASFTGSDTVPAGAYCSVTSTLVASAAGLCNNQQVTATTTSTCPVTGTPSVQVTLSCPATPPLPGAALAYSGTVVNNGTIPLTNVVVVSDHPAANTVVFRAATLAPGGSAAFTGSFVAPTNACGVTSALGVTAQEICAGTTVANSATSACPLNTTPGLGVTLGCPAGPLIPGATVTCTGTIVNSGNDTLLNVVLSAAAPATNGVLLIIPSLGPGASAPFSANFIAPVNSCTMGAAVSVTGVDSCSSASLTNSAAASCPLTATPGISVTKLCPAAPVPRGGLYVFTGFVTNAGNVTLTNVVVFNSQNPAIAVLTAPTLAPGSSMSFTGSYTAPLCCCVIVDTLTASGQGPCAGTSVTSTSTSVCPLLTTPAIALTQNCPASPIPMGSVYMFSGYVTNTGDAFLTNVFVFGPQGTNSPALGPIDLFPGESEFYSGSYTVPFNTCSVTVTAVGQDTCAGNVALNTASCPVAITPGITVTESCPPAPVTAGSAVVFGGLVSNSGNITLTNIFVFSSSAGNSAAALGPITLAPGASAPFTGGYTALGGSNPATNSAIVTNSSVSITTNVVSVISTNNATVIMTNGAAATSFGTINAVSKAVVDGFGVPPNLEGLTYDASDAGYGATEFYSMREDATGAAFFDTIIASTATTTDRFDAGNLTFDALAYAAGNLGYGPLLFYYLRQDNAGVSTFGSIAPGGVVGVTTDHFVVGNNFDALTFSATDVGYGVNLFYYVRHDATGLSTFGTINPALPGTVTDRFTVGSGVIALAFTAFDLGAGYGPDNFYYLRGGAGGATTFGTIFVTGLTTATVTDRFGAGANATALTFAPDNVGSGLDLFYYLRGGGLSFTTNVVTTFTTNTAATFTTNTATAYTTNSVVSFTTTNTVTAVGMDTCQGGTVAAAASCLGPVALDAAPGQPVSTVRVLAMAKGVFNLSFATENGKSYIVQYKNSLNDPAWTDLETVVGTGGSVAITDADAAQEPTRFYRVVPGP